MMPFRFLLFVLCLVTFSAKAADTDSQVWSSLTTTANIAPRWDANLELHARFTENAQTTGQRLIRPSLTYKINDHLSLTGGYFYGVFNTSTRPSFHEQRVWEQVGYKFWNEKGGTALSGRTRLEQRFVENRGDTGWRLRQQLRFETPLPIGMPKGLLWNETFIGLNNTSWGQRSDFDQTRTFIGFVIPLAEGISVEPGYLNQIISRTGNNDSVNHIAAVNFYLRF